MIESIKKEVYNLLKNDNSGHGMDHINRVLDLSIKFAKKENANQELVSLIALLHDCDDYKLFGNYNSKELTNTRIIMNKCNIDKSIQEQVCVAINNIGYSKRLKGLYPKSLEGQIVSDADMCNALGSHGILRLYTFTLNNNGKFFDRNIFPIDNITASEYNKKYANTGICHFFEKILKLKDLMLTNAGKDEASKRHKIVVDFLYQYFAEENALEWIEYLDNYLLKQESEAKLCLKM